VLQENSAFKQEQAQRPSGKHTYSYQKARWTESQENPTDVDGSFVVLSNCYPLLPELVRVVLQRLMIPILVKPESEAKQESRDEQ
jgi:hypothetical protein